jgi:hypothetical protein
LRPELLDWFFRTPIRHKFLLANDNKPSMKITLYRLLSTILPLAYLFLRVGERRDEPFLSTSDQIAGVIGIASVLTSLSEDLPDWLSQLSLAWLGRK